MKAQAWDKNMILIAVTGWGQSNDRRKAREAGFDDHLVKPLELDSLRAALARWTNRTDRAKVSAG